MIRQSVTMAVLLRHRSHDLERLRRVHALTRGDDALEGDLPEAVEQPAQLLLAGEHVPRVDTGEVMEKLEQVVAAAVLVMREAVGVTVGPPTMAVVTRVPPGVSSSFQRWTMSGLSAPLMTVRNSSVTMRSKEALGRSPVSRFSQTHSTLNPCRSAYHWQARSGVRQMS